MQGINSGPLSDGHRLNESQEIKKSDLQPPAAQLPSTTDKISYIAKDTINHPEESDFEFSGSKPDSNIKSLVAFLNENLNLKKPEVSNQPQENAKNIESNIEAESKEAEFNQPEESDFEFNAMPETKNESLVEFLNENLNLKKPEGLNLEQEKAFFEMGHDLGQIQQELKSKPNVEAKPDINAENEQIEAEFEDNPVEQAQIEASPPAIIDPKDLQEIIDKLNTNDQNISSQSLLSEIFTKFRSLGFDPKLETQLNSKDGALTVEAYQIKDSKLTHYQTQVTYKIVLPGIDLPEIKRPVYTNCTNPESALVVASKFVAMVADVATGKNEHLKLNSDEKNLVMSNRAFSFNFNTQKDKTTEKVREFSLRSISLYNDKKEMTAEFPWSNEDPKVNRYVHDFGSGKLERMDKKDLKLQPGQAVYKSMEEALHSLPVTVKDDHYYENLEKSDSDISTHIRSFNEQIKKNENDFSAVKDNFRGWFSNTKAYNEFLSSIALLKPNQTIDKKLLNSLPPHLKELATLKSSIKQLTDVTHQLDEIKKRESEKLYTAQKDIHADNQFMKQVAKELNKDFTGIDQLIADMKEYTSRVNGKLGEIQKKARKDQAPLNRSLTELTRLNTLLINQRNEMMAMVTGAQNRLNSDDLTQINQHKAQVVLQAFSSKEINKLNQKIADNQAEIDKLTRGLKKENIIDSPPAVENPEKVVQVKSDEEIEMEEYSLDVSELPLELQK